MTLSVPYSFVPGTKAKADEVNANFIAVLDKIEETNTTKANIDLSNLDDAGKSVLNAKADKSEIDGEWVSTHQAFASNIDLNGSSYLSYDLSPYLPNDENMYEIILSGRSVTSNTIGAYAPLLVRTSFLSGTVYVCSCRARTAANVNGAGTVTIPIGADKQLSVVRTADYDGSFYLTLAGYRKVR